MVDRCKEQQAQSNSAVGDVPTAAFAQLQAEKDELPPRQYLNTSDAAGNVLTLGAPALDDPAQLIETLEHEFIHVLQDEVAGLANSDMATLGLPTTTEAIHAVAHGYGHTSAEVQHLELEAHSAEHLLQNPETVLSRTPLGLEQELAVAYTAHGMSPLEASLQASLDAPMLESFLS